MIVGQKVVCVDDSAPFHLRNHYTYWIKKGTTYVVREVFLGISMRGSPGEVGIYLLGIRNPCSEVPPYLERGYNSERFRPIEEMPLRERELISEEVK